MNMTGFDKRDAGFSRMSESRRVLLERRLVRRPGLLRCFIVCMVVSETVASFLEEFQDGSKS